MCESRISHMLKVFSKLKTQGFASRWWRSPSLWWERCGSACFPAKNAELGVLAGENSQELWGYNGVNYGKLGQTIFNYGTLWSNEFLLGFTMDLLGLYGIYHGFSDNILGTDGIQRNLWIPTMVQKNWEYHRDREYHGIYKQEQAAYPWVSSHVAMEHPPAPMEVSPAKKTLGHVWLHEGDIIHPLVF